MGKSTDSKNNNDILSLIKNVGGAQSIHKYLTSKGYKINIDSIYKWKTNGIPHRYRTIINELINKNKNKTNNKKIQPEIISSYWNFNKFLKILYIIIPIIIFFLFYNQNEKKLNSLYTKIYNLEKELKNTRNNIKNSHKKNINEINNKLKVQSDINTENNEKINKALSLYSAHEKKLKQVQSNSKIINNEENKQKLDYIINHNDALFYLLWLKDNFNNKNNKFNKLPFIIEFISKNDLPVNIEKSLSVISNLNKIDLKSNKELLSEIKNILSNNKDKKNIKKDDKINNILNKIKNLIKISKIDNNSNQKLLLQNLNRELTNKKYDNVLYLISASKINSSNKLNNWIKSVNKISDLDKSINNVINWIINEG